MAVDFSNVLVVGVSTRSLFNLEKENELYEKEGIAAYRRYQLDHENEPLEHGTAFALVRNLLKLNELSLSPLLLSILIKLFKDLHILILFSRAFSEIFVKL